MEKFKRAKEILIGIESDAEKFYKNQNSSAGTRLRKNMQEIKNLAQEIRKEVLELKNKEK